MVEHAWREKRLLDDLQAVADQTDRLPTRDKVSLWGSYPPSAYIQVFGTFESALQLIVDPESDEEQEPSRQELLVELQRLSFGREKVIRRDELRRKTEYSLDAYDAVFGSVRDALKQAGVIEVVEEYDHQIPTREILADIQRVSYEVGGYVTVREYLQRGEFSLGVIQDRWETWLQALSDAEVIESPEAYDVSREELIGDIRRVGDELGSRPSREEYVEHGAFSVYKINKELGWSAALVLAGYERPVTGQQIDERDLQEEFHRVEMLIGETPSWKDFRMYGKYSEAPYLRVCGDWGAVVDRFSKFS